MGNTPMAASQREYYDVDDLLDDKFSFILENTWEEKIK